MFKEVKTIAFDADDTLWNNETLFREAERKWAEVMKDYGSLEELSAILYKREAENMEALGFGAKPYLISVLETSVALAGDKLTGSMVGKIIAAGREIIDNPATPYEGVKEALEAIRAKKKYRMVMLTKGDLLDQEHKIARSGLGPLFDRIVITSNKSKKEYQDLCKEEGIAMEEFLMWGAYIPSHVIWVHEVVEEYPHPRLLKLASLSELPAYL